MTRIRNDKPLDDRAFELLVAEEDLILHAQMLIQGVLNEQGVSQKALAQKLGVSESYVSQMLGLSPRNLTLRTIARVMAALNVKATLSLDEHRDAAPAGAEDDEATAVVSRLASGRFSTVWGDLVELDAGRRGGRRRDGDAAAYASFEPAVQEMALAA